MAVWRWVHCEQRGVGWAGGPVLSPPGGCGWGCVSWSSTGSLPLEEVVGLFDRATLEQLRNECGGVQTLLRNQHQVFEGGARSLPQ